MKNLIWVCCALLVGCSTASVRVMPGVEKNKVVVKDIKKESAEEEAVEAAKEYCEAKDKEAVFVTNKTQYEGEMDEGTRNAIKNGSTAAMVLGSGKKSGLLGDAGLVGHMMTSNKDYTSEVEFLCR
jgi:hypothetical protein